AVDQTLRGDRVDVLAFDRLERRREYEKVLRDLVLPREEAASEQPACQCRDEDGQNRYGEKPRSAHSTMVTDEVPRTQGPPGKAGGLSRGQPGPRPAPAECWPARPSGLII